MRKWDECEERGLREKNKNPKAKDNLNKVPKVGQSTQSIMLISSFLSHEAKSLILMGLDPNSLILHKNVVGRLIRPHYKKIR